jgi:uncharacterized tellurite resistance protein B-like protein
MGGMPSLNREDTLRLLRFVCSFAWADQQIQPEERSFVERLSKGLGLTGEDLLLVQSWLEVPPPADELDPNDIPQEHRVLFLEAARAMVESDKNVDPLEQEELALFEMLLQD